MADLNIHVLVSFEDIVLLQMYYYKYPTSEIHIFHFISQNLNLPFFYKNLASMFTWAEKREIQILKNAVEDMYFKSRILKTIYLYQTCSSCFSNNAEWGILWIIHWIRFELKFNIQSKKFEVMHTDVKPTFFRMTL